MWHLPRVVWAVAVGRFVTSASSFLLLFLTLYLTGPRGLNTATAGLIAGSLGAGLLLGNFTGGRWGDRYGHRRIALIASTVAGILVVSVPVQPTALMVATLPVHAYLVATAGVSLGALTALAVERGERRTMVAVSRAASNAGFVLGPPLGALLAAWSFDALFVVDGLVLILVRFALAPFLPRHQPMTDAAKSGGLFAALCADRALCRLLVAVVMVDLVYRQLYTTLPLYLRDEGMPLGLYAGVIALGSGLILLLEIPVALRLRRFQAYPIIAVGYALVGVGFALFAVPVSVATAVIAMVVLTTGEILYKTTATAHVLDAAPHHLVGQYQGLYNGAATSGTLLAAPIGGALYAFAPAILWPVCGLLALLAAASVLACRADPGNPAQAPNQSGAEPIE